MRINKAAVHRIFWILFFPAFSDMSCVFSHLAARGEPVNHKNDSFLLWSNDIYLGIGNYTPKTINEILEDNTLVSYVNYTLQNNTDLDHKPEREECERCEDSIGTRSNNMLMPRSLNEVVEKNMHSAGSKRGCYSESVKKEVHRKLARYYRLKNLPTPEKRSIFHIKALLTQGGRVEFENDACTGNENLYNDIVYIRNSTVHLSGKELLGNLIFDSDSICRLSIQWFERYPKYVAILRDRLGQFNHKHENMTFRGQVKKNHKRSFINKWILILKQLKTLEIDDKSLEIYKGVVEKQAKGDPTRFRSYHRNIGVELHVFNILLLVLLNKLTYILPYVLYFPKTGNIAHLLEKKHKSGDEFIYYSDKSKNANLREYEDSVLKRIQKIDLFSMESRENITENVESALYSCSNVIEIILKYGISLESTPREVVSLFIQYKKIVLILLNIFSIKNTKMNQLDSDSNRRVKPENDYSTPTSQSLYPNFVGFCPRSR